MLKMNIRRIIFSFKNSLVNLKIYPNLNLFWAYLTQQNYFYK